MGRGMGVVWKHCVIYTTALGIYGLWIFGNLANPSPLLTMYGWLYHPLTSYLSIQGPFMCSCFPGCFHQNKFLFISCKDGLLAIINNIKMLIIKNLTIFFQICGKIRALHTTGGHLNYYRHYRKWFQQFLWSLSMWLLLYSQSIPWVCIREK